MDANDTPITEAKPVDPVRTREQLLAWWMRTMNEVHWMSDLLMREQPPFRASLSPLLCNDLGILLDQVWHRIVRNTDLVLAAPAEFR